MSCRFRTEIRWVQYVKIINNNVLPNCTDLTALAPDTLES